MNNDLISREALKKDFEERNKACDKWIENAKDEETKIRADATKNFICEVIMTIDNAPTVDTTCPHCDSGYAQGYSDGYLKGKEERPQGKWFDCIEKTALKARHGDYVLYKIDYLLDHLAREIYLLESAKRMKGGAE